MKRSSSLDSLNKSQVTTSDVTKPTAPGVGSTDDSHSQEVDQDEDDDDDDDHNVAPFHPFDAEKYHRNLQIGPPRDCCGFRIKQIFGASTIAEKDREYPIQERDFSKYTFLPFVTPCSHHNREHCDLSSTPQRYRFIEAVAKKKISARQYMEWFDPKVFFYEENLPATSELTYLF
jgi:hypothetical protein